jgi:DNA-binding CsgD family transcriptional regulator
MANHVMWYLRNKPSEQIFQEGLQRMIHEAELSAQEQRIVIYHLLGYSYDEMADLLTISIKTVKKHISTIHYKTGTHRQRELFARYFSPRIAFQPTASTD